MVKSYRELKVWQKAMDFAEHVCRAQRKFPAEERYGLCDQLRRAAVSIPSNIAEGYGREGDKEHSHFLYMSLGSSNELETQMILSHDFQYVGNQDYQEIMDLNSEVNKMLSSLIYKLRHPNPQELKNS